MWTIKANGTRNGRTVIDIRALNKITLPDAYLMPSQADILADLQRATHISTVDFDNLLPVESETRSETLTGCVVTL